MSGLINAPPWSVGAALKVSPRSTAPFGFGSALPDAALPLCSAGAGWGRNPAVVAPAVTKPALARNDLRFMVLMTKWVLIFLFVPHGAHLTVVEEWDGSVGVAHGGGVLGLLVNVPIRHKTSKVLWGDFGL